MPEIVAEVERLQAENDRLRALVLQVAERLFLAAEVLSIRAEKKGRRNETTHPQSR